MSGRMPLNLELRRRQEDRVQAAQAMVLDTAKVAGRVDFEHRTDRMIKSLLVRQQIAAANVEVKKRINERRAKLAALLESEKRQYEREIEATFESPEQAKQRILAHARTLKAESDANRKALVAQLEERRFRLSSDAYRARQSQILTERTALDRVAQLQERAEVMRRQQEEQAREAAALDGAARAAQAEKAAELEARRRLEAEMRQVLEVQINVKKDLHGRESSWEAQEVQRLLEADRAAAEAQAAADRGRREHARVEYERTQQYNAREKAIKDRAAALESEADRRDLEATLARERAEAEAEREAATARRRDALAFKSKLESQMAIQAEDKGWLDEFYAKESEKEWEKRQAKWDREAAARRALEDEVAASRLRQMEDKRAKAAMEAQEDARQLTEFQRRQAEDAAREAERQAKRRAHNALAGEQNRAQMEADARARDAVKQQEYLDWRLQQKFEKQYDDRVQKLLNEGSRRL